MNTFEHPQHDNLHNIDLRTIDGGRLIFPSKAEGSDIENLELEGINIPVSFFMLPEGYFRMNGVMEGVSAGLVMSGFIFNQDAKINHVLIDEVLKRHAKEHGNQQIGKTALRHLEEKLSEQNITTVYAVFYTPEIVEFFRRNGYKIISIDSLENQKRKKLGIDPNGFDTRVKSNESFDDLKSTNPDDYRHILLVKHLINTTEPTSSV